MSDIMNRLLEKVKLDEETGCWMWQGAGDKNGYGCMKIDGRRGKAHRWMYEAVFGKFDRKLLVCHHCDTPACVNPAHLFLGNDADNIRDKVSKGRQARGEMFSSRTKLTQDAVLEIRERYARGNVTQQELAQQYGVGIMQVSRIIRHKRWAHVL